MTPDPTTPAETLAQHGEQPKIETHYTNRKGPFRTHDWVAYVDGLSVEGFGATEAEAVQNLKVKMEKANAPVTSLRSAAQAILSGRDELAEMDDMAGEDLRHFLFKDFQLWESLRTALAAADRAEASIARMRALLATLEWSGSGWDYAGDPIEVCPACGGAQTEGHIGTCALSAALAADAEGAVQ